MKKPFPILLLAAVTFSIILAGCGAGIPLHVTVTPIGSTNSVNSSRTNDDLKVYLEAAVINKLNTDDALRHTPFSVFGKIMPYLAKVALPADQAPPNTVVGNITISTEAFPQRTIDRATDEAEDLHADAVVLTNIELYFITNGDLEEVNSFSGPGLHKYQMVRRTYPAGYTWTFKAVRFNSVNTTPPAR